MAHEGYADQVRLLVRVLPIIAKETVFALKGGTAINLFYRDMPRLSVDIDLTYLPIGDRATALTDIDQALGRIAAAITDGHGDIAVRRIAGGGGGETRLQVQAGGAVIKVETTPVARGTVLPPVVMTVTDAVEEKFGFAEIQVVSFEDLFGGKIHAALDRQHPRDLYDVKLLYDNEGLTDDLFHVFLVYLAGSNRPAHELLNPNSIDLTRAFEREFQGMTSSPIGQEELEAVRIRLVEDVQSRLTESAADFLRSLQQCAPDYSLIGLSEAAALPAVRWKLTNLEKLKNENPDKHSEQSAALDALLR